MKAVILAGGLGTRLSEETGTKPKPMVEIGGKPILWHIMKIYTAHGITDFIICLGYKGYVIKEYFANYSLHTSDVTIDIQNNSIHTLQRSGEPWRISLIDTGEETQIGGRIRHILPLIGDDEAFCLTYGDGVADVDIGASIEFHRSHGRLATVTAVQPPGRFGVLTIGEEDFVGGFTEKPIGDGSWINGGFFVLSPKVGAYIAGSSTVWEREPMETLAADRQLKAWHHHGFWKPMDTLRDKRELDALWSADKAPWKVW